MQTSFGDSRGAAESREGPHVVAGIDRQPQLSGEDPVALCPGRRREPLRGLGDPMGPQLGGKGVGHGEGAPAAVRLGLGGSQTAAVAERAIGG